MKLFVFDPIWDKLITPTHLAKLCRVNVELIINQTVAPLNSCEALYDGSEPRILAINPDYVAWKLSSDDYQNIPNLKAILGAATSFAWIDRTAADALKIPICNIRNFSTEAVAEWAIGMMFNVARRVPLLMKDKFPLDFDKDFFTYRGIELHGKTAGFVGLGNIGAALAKRCAGLGMKVIYWSRGSKQVPYEHVDLKKLFSDSDVIFPVLADNPDTKKLISDPLLQSMKSSAILISVVHDLFNEQLVLDMVRAGKLFGYGFEAKPGSFFEYEGNVWAAPAYAWVTDGSMNNSMDRWIENMVWAVNGEFPCCVNV